MRLRVTAFALMIAIVGSAAHGCPEETVEFGTVTIRDFSGRIVPSIGDELPTNDLHFTVRERDKEDPQEWAVYVPLEGSFSVPLPEGTYEFSIKPKGYLFTAQGVIVIDRDADEERWEFSLPWC